MYISQATRLPRVRVMEALRTFLVRHIAVFLLI